MAGSPRAELPMPPASSKPRPAIQISGDLELELSHHSRCPLAATSFLWFKKTKKNSSLHDTTQHDFSVFFTFELNSILFRLLR